MANTREDLISIDEASIATLNEIDEGPFELGSESEGFEVEEEEQGEGGEIETITEPFDPSKIRISSFQYSIQLLIDRLQNDEIDLMPDFQRQGGLWTQKAMSQLIESLLIRIPLPAFYFDGSTESKWLVVDGLQRLTTLKRFMIDQPGLPLVGLEFLQTELAGKRYADLSRSLQRRILETQVTVYVIQEGTPPEVKFNVFKRINTGGLPLSSQEIRHALYQGPATDLLKELAESPLFLESTAHGVKAQRMQDRECVLRVLAFLHVPYHSYNTKDLDRFLNSVVQDLNRPENCAARLSLMSRFVTSLEWCQAIFEKEAFRKISRDYYNRRGPINRGLMEAWIYNVDQLREEQRHLLLERKGRLRDRFLKLLDVPIFSQSISYGTSSPASIQNRFSGIRHVIRDTLEEPA